MEPEKQGKTVSYLALGDSYTIGERVERSLNWPEQLSQKLEEMGIPVENPRIVAATGWTTGELENGIVKANLSGKFDLVSLLIGVNNQYRGLPLEDFRKGYRRLLHTALVFAGNRKDRVIVLSIPDWGVMPFAEGRDRKKIANQIDRFNAVKKVETEKMGIRFFDITGISRLAGNNTSLVAEDGLHPSVEMYRMWVEKISGGVAEMLKEEVQ